jgi:hypothetical protein
MFKRKELSTRQQLVNIDTLLRKSEFDRAFGQDHREFSRSEYRISEAESVKCDNKRWTATLVLAAVTASVFGVSGWFTTETLITHLLSFLGFATAGIILGVMTLAISAFAFFIGRGKLRARRVKRMRNKLVSDSISGSKDLMKSLELMCAAAATESEIDSGFGQEIDAALASLPGLAATMASIQRLEDDNLPVPLEADRAVRDATRAFHSLSETVQAEHKRLVDAREERQRQLDMAKKHALEAGVDPTVVVEFELEDLQRVAETARQIQSIRRTVDAQFESQQLTQH